MNFEIQATTVRWETMPERFIARMAADKSGSPMASSQHRSTQIELADIHAQLEHDHRQLSQSPRLRISELAGLRSLHRETGQLLEAVNAEFCKTANTVEGHVSSELMAEILDSCRRRMLRLENQYRLFDHFDSAIGEYQTAIDELLYQPKVTANRFEKIVKRIAIDVEQCRDSFFLLPEAGCSLENYLCRYPSVLTPEVHAAGLLTTRMLAWTGAKRHDDSQQQDLLMASLLADVGLIPLVLSRRLPVERLQAERVAEFRKHAHISAGIAAGITGLPMRVNTLITQHHERLDGSGYPDERRKKDPGNAVRELQIAVRFEELLRDSRKQVLRQIDSNQTPETLIAVANQLYREARLGEFEEPLVEQFLQCFDCSLRSETNVPRLTRHDAHTLHSTSPYIAAELQRIAARAASVVTESGVMESSSILEPTVDQNIGDQKTGDQSAGRSRRDQINADIPEPYFRKRVQSRRQNMIRSSRRR